MKQSKNKNNLFRTLLLIGLLINFFIIVLAHNLAINSSNKKYVSNMLAELEKIHSEFTLEQVFTPMLNELYFDVAGKDSGQAQLAVLKWAAKYGLSADAFEIILFRDHEPLNVHASEKSMWKQVLASFDHEGIRKLRSQSEYKNKLIRFLGAGVGIEMLELQPDLLVKISRSGLRTYAYWNSQPETFKQGTSGVIIFLHEQGINEKMIAEKHLVKVADHGQAFGYIDSLNPEHSAIPADCNANLIMSLTEGLGIKSHSGTYESDNKKFILSIKPDGKIFFCSYLPPSTPVPLWTIALAFFWIPSLWKSISSSENSLKIPLKLLLHAVFILSILLPAVATGLYWSSYISTKRETIKIEKTRQLENYLIELDASFQSIFRVSAQRFKLMTELIDGRLENLQQFIDLSIIAELEAAFDTLLLVTEDGEFVRPYSSSANQVRQIAFYPRKYREHLIKQYFAKGWVPFEREFEFVMNPTSAGLDVKNFISLNPPEAKKTITALGQMAGRDLITNYNQDKGFASQNLKQNISSMVLGSFFEDQSENPMGKLRQNIGGFVEFGLGAKKSVNYVDLIRNRQGKAIYCAIFFAAHHNFASNYLQKTLVRDARWPKNIKYMAISPLLFRNSYPHADLWKRFDYLVKLMQPPRNLYAEERNLNGKPHLLCAYRGKNNPDHILIATVSLADIESELTPIKAALAAGMALIFVFIAFILWRLYCAVITPTAQILHGVKAMEKRNHDYRISIDSKDEWQALGETFNSALEGLKELEIANFVQSCILPSEPIICGNSLFYGRTCPADDVGGDYFDAVKLDNDNMVFVMGDVSGHSVSAALVVAMARAAFVGLVDQGLTMPDEIFTRINTLMLEQLRRIKMMSCFSGHITRDGLLTCCNAGQAYPFIVQNDGKTEIVKLTGYPLGAAKRKKFKASTIQLPDQCRLVMFSDGIIEAMNNKSEPFGYERMEALVSELGCQIKAKEFIDSVYRHLRVYSQDQPWDDDVTIVILDYNRS